MKLLRGPRRATWPPRFASARHLSRLQSFFAMLLALLYAGATVGASNVTKYTYDAAGNITQIQRLTAAGFAITGFDPAFGSVDTVVTIYGTGFSTTAASNAVAFNGVAAVVSASDAGSIRTTVPAGATSGRITVTVGGVTATSASDFIVTVPGAPVITGFAPVSGVAGDTITLSGSNFDASTTVKLNGMAVVVTVIDSTQLTFKVPAGTSSGKIVAANSSGTATSINDFIVPPPGLLVGDVVTSVRLQLDAGNRNLIVGTSGKSGVALFDAAPGVPYSIQLAMEPSPTNAVVPYTVIKPDNTVQLSGSVGGNNYAPSIHLPALSAAGTYSLLLSPGTTTLNVNLRIETDPLLVVDGPALASSLDATFQSARYFFDATANQHLGVGISHLTFVVAPAYASASANARLRIFRPDGLEIAASTPVYCYGVVQGNSGGNCDSEFVAPITGRYSLIFEDPFYGYGQYSVMLNSDVNGTLLPDAPQTVSLARAGQDARFTFAASAGDSFGVDLSAISLQPQAGSLALTIYKPDGTVYKYCSATQSQPSYCELGTLAAGGTYAIAVDPANGAFGTFVLTLKQGAMLGATDPPLAFAMTNAAESARFRFAGTAGQNLSVGISALATGASNGYANLVLYGPNGTALFSGESCYVAWDGCRSKVTNLPQSGIYSVALQPQAGPNVSGNVTLSQDLVGILQPGLPQDISARSGQLARYTFDGVAGDSTSIKLLGVSTTPATNITTYISVLRPGGTQIGAASASATSSAAFVNLASLPATGTYTVTIDPGQGGAWQGRLELDPGAPIVIDGDSVLPRTSAAGEALRYTFGATAGQRIEIGMTGLALSTSSTYVTLDVYNPTGVNLASRTCYTYWPGCDISLASAPATGTYSLVVTPPALASITGGAVTLSSPLTGTLNAGDPAQTIAISRIGQTARYSFTGTTGQLLRLNWSGASLTTAPGVSVSVTVLKPDGTTLSYGSFTNGSTSGFDIAALPSSGTYTVVFDPDQGVTMSASVSLVTRP